LFTQYGDKITSHWVSWLFCKKCNIFIDKVTSKKRFKQFSIVHFTEAALLLKIMLIKSQLIAEISQKMSHLPEKDIALSINSIIEQMSEKLSQGGRIEIRGFGSFCLHYRPPRKAHNPKTGEKLITQPKYAVHFKPGKELREHVNNSRNIPLQEGDIGDSDEADE
jgi:integration host factor subunit beta